MTKTIILVAVSVFVISLSIFAREVLAQDENGEMTSSPPEAISTPELDVPAAQDVQDEKFPSLVISATGYETPQSRVSSDITVITKEDISHLPAHDVGEALNYVTGVTLTRGGGPGTPPSPSIQGSDYTHVKILIDGIPIETLLSGFPDLSLIPLESVDRIEILKGSASSVWGSSLGGVINIITKRPPEKMQAEGGVSIGENSTRNYKAGISGKVKDTGYFFSASRFETDGFFDYQKARNDYFYAKVTEEISPELKAEVSYRYTSIDRDDSGWIANEKTVDQHGRVMLRYTPKQDYELSISAYDRELDSKSIDIATNTDNFRDKENMYGGTLRSVWQHSKESTFSMGVEGNHGNLKLTTDATDENYDTDKGAVFANESLGIGALTLNAGARYDNDSAFGSELSPSAGVVYKISAGTLLRVNAARGFSPPPLPYRYQGVSPNSGLNAERAWTSQAGIESDSIPGLWGKITFYRADVTDKVTWLYDENDVNGNGNTGEILSFINLNEVRRQGVEVEAKTKESKGLGLSYGYAFNDYRDLETDEVVKGQPRIIQNAGVDYKGPFETRANINGRYIWWNAIDSDNAKDKTWVWDAKVSKYLAKWKYAIGEIFVSVHNITDEDQYQADFYPNPGRWVEAGISLTTF
ncbi:MAG: hypothetical protein HW415_315 [Deltaproteobacteria bacterium]|nr:hypothetical protein [Deltaproteobacteria bacterium]